MPLASVSLATIVFEPWASPAGVKLQVPEPFAVVVPRVLLFSVSVTTALASPPPVNASFEVTLSELELPVSLTSEIVTGGGGGGGDPTLSPEATSWLELLTLNVERPPPEVFVTGYGMDKYTPVYGVAGPLSVPGVTLKASRVSALLLGSMVSQSFVAWSPVCPASSWNATRPLDSVVSP